MIQRMLAIWSLVPLPFLSPAEHLEVHGPISKIDVLFIIGDWNAKVGIQEIPGVTGKFGLGVQNEAGQRLTILSRWRTGHSKHSLLTTQEKTIHGHHQMVNTKMINLYSLQPKMENLCAVRKTRPGADCVSDHERFIAKFRLKLKKSTENH